MPAQTDVTEWPDFMRRCEQVGFTAVLQRFCDEAQEQLPAVGVSVRLQTANGMSTVAASKPVALELDELQYRVNEGPCVLAASEQHPVDVPRLRSEEAWPQWTPAALAAGVESVHAVALRSVPEPGDLGGYIGALNVYGATQDAFADPVVQVEMRALGQLAAIMVGNARLYSMALLNSAPLRAAVLSNSPT